MQAESYVLSCSLNLKVNRPAEDVFNAVYQPEQLSSYFATGGASGPLDAGKTVHWSFHDHPQFPPFPVKVIEGVPFERLHLQWQSGIGTVGTTSCSRSSRSTIRSNRR